MLKAASCLVVAGTVLALGAPAFAQMKMSAPAAAPAAIGMGDNRPTFLPSATALFGMGGLETARVLPSNQAIYSFGGLNLDLGLGNNMEGRGSVFMSLPGWSLLASGSGKYIFMNSGSMTVAAGGALGIGSKLATPFDLSVSAFAPISLWKLGPGDLHIVPAITVPSFLTGTAFAAPLSFINVGAGYAYPLTPKLTLVAANNLNLAFANTFSLGGRLTFSPNLTFDFVPLTLTGATIGLGFLGVGGHFGANLGDILKGITP